MRKTGNAFPEPETPPGTGGERDCKKPTFLAGIFKLRRIIFSLSEAKFHSLLFSGSSLSENLRTFKDPLSGKHKYPFIYLSNPKSFFEMKTVSLRGIDKMPSVGRISFCERIGTHYRHFSADAADSCFNLNLPSHGATCPTLICQAKSQRIK